MTRPHPSLCPTCQIKRRAGEGAPYCYDCMPGGPFPEPPCRRCGSSTDYFSMGLCSRCHYFAPRRVGSCRECFAWGVTRLRDWRCRSCYNFKDHPIGVCASCGRTMHVNARSFCVLCIKTAAYGPRLAGSGLRDVLTPNRNGQQLYFADMVGARSRRTRPGEKKSPPPLLAPVTHRQLVLFDLPRDLSEGFTKLASPVDAARAAGLDAFARQYATKQTWRADYRWRVRTGIRVLLSLQTTPGAVIAHSETAVLFDVGLPARTVGEVLAAAGWWEDDRGAAIESWFDDRVAGLPELMDHGLRTWFEVMRRGSTTAPRRQPRSDTTTRLYLTWALPAIEAWVESGHVSFREIATADVLAALPESGVPRAQCCRALRCIFAILKGRRLVFVDPTSRIHAWVPTSLDPLPVDVGIVRTALDDPSPARAAVAALVAFHGLRTSQLRDLQLIDVRDGRLRVEDRVIVLADPVRSRVRAWLDYRDARWPTSTNPHLFIHFRSANRIEPVGRRWIKLTLAIPGGVQAVRDDRILHEAHATGGDARRLQDFFGIGVNAAVRYTATVDHPDLVADRPR